MECRQRPLVHKLRESTGGAVALPAVLQIWIEPSDHGRRAGLTSRSPSRWATDWTLCCSIPKAARGRWP